MRREAAIPAIFAAILAVAAIGYLILAATPAKRDRNAQGDVSQPRTAAKAPAALIPAPVRPEASQVPPAGPKVPAGAAAAGSGPAERDPAADPTKAASPAPGPRGVLGAAAGASEATADITNDQVLAKVKEGEKGFEVLASRIDLGKAAIAPRWEAGDAWVVETYYRQMQASNEVWSGPALWSFHVSRETGFRDRPCFEVVVTREGGEEMPPTTIYVTRDGHRLAGIRTSVTQAGKTREVTWAPDDADVAGGSAQGTKAPLTIVPFDLPPVGAEARVVPAGLAGEPPLIEGAGRGRMPKPDELLGAGDSLLSIEYESPVDGTLVHQRWSRSDMRWPVESRTETTWSFRRKSP